jgi:hypothetical protein
MPKNSEKANQQQEAPAEETAPAAAAKKRSRKAPDTTNQEPAEAAPANPAPQPAPTPAAEPENGKAAPAPLSGLHGADYVKALVGHPLVSVEVPLLPTERRGDWERAKGVKIRVTMRQLSAQPGTSSVLQVERDHALAALVIELQRPGVTRFDQIDLRGSPTREAVDHLSDYTNHARLRAQAQTGKKWTASQVYLIPQEDA